MKLKELIDLCVPHTWLSVRYNGKKYIGFAKYHNAVTGELEIDEDFARLGNKEIKEIEISKRGDLMIKLKEKNND